MFAKLVLLDHHDNQNLFLVQFEEIQLNFPFLFSKEFLKFEKYSIKIFFITKFNYFYAISTKYNSFQLK